MLTKNTSALRDELNFDLVDTRPHQLPGNTFHIQWSFVEFDRVLYNVSETDGELHIPVRRHGLTKQVIETNDTDKGVKSVTLSFLQTPGGIPLAAHWNA